MVGGLCGGFFARTLFDVVDDAVGGKEAEDDGLALVAGLRLGTSETDNVLGLCRGDGAIDFLGQEFGVAVVRNHARFEC